MSHLKIASMTNGFIYFHGNYSDVLLWVWKMSYEAGKRCKDLNGKRG